MPPSDTQDSVLPGLRPLGGRRARPAARRLLAAAMTAVARNVTGVARKIAADGTAATAVDSEMTAVAREVTATGGAKTAVGTEVTAVAKATTAAAGMQARLLHPFQKQKLVIRCRTWHPRRRDNGETNRSFFGGTQCGD